MGHPLADIIERVRVGWTLEELLGAGYKEHNVLAVLDARDEARARAARRREEELVDHISETHGMTPERYEEAIQQRRAVVMADSPHVWQRLVSFLGHAGAPCDATIRKRAGSSDPQWWHYQDRPNPAGGTRKQYRLAPETNWSARPEEPPQGDEDMPSAGEFKKVEGEEGIYQNDKGRWEVRVQGQALGKRYMRRRKYGEAYELEEIRSIREDMKSRLARHGKDALDKYDPPRPGDVIRELGSAPFTSLEEDMLAELSAAEARIEELEAQLRGAPDPVDPRECVTLRAQLVSQAEELERTKGLLAERTLELEDSRMERAELEAEVEELAAKKDGVSPLRERYLKMLLRDAFQTLTILESRDPESFAIYNGAEVHRFLRLAARELQTTRAPNDTPSREDTGSFSCQNSQISLNSDAELRTLAEDRG